MLTGDWTKLRREGTPAWDCVSRLAQAAYLVVLQRADMETGVLPLPPGDELERLSMVIGLGRDPIEELLGVGAIEIGDRLARIPEVDWNAQQGADSNAQRCKRRRNRIEAHNSDTLVTQPDTERHESDTQTTTQDKTRQDKTRVKPLSAKPPVSANDAYFDEVLSTINLFRRQAKLGPQRDRPNNRKAVAKVRRGEGAEVVDWVHACNVAAVEIQGYDSRVALGTSRPGEPDPRKFFTLQSLARGDNFSRKLNAPDPSPKSNTGESGATQTQYPAPIRTQWEVDQERMRREEVPAPNY